MTDSNAPAFIDTAYINALVNTRDQWNQVALQWQRHLTFIRRPLLTTEFVLTEIADSLAAIRFRHHAATTIAALRTSSFAEVVPVSSRLFDEAWALFASRSDKEWGLTDCSSIVTMQKRGIVDVLTSDRHFRQAGLRPLLLEDVPR